MIYYCIFDIKGTSCNYMIIMNYYIVLPSKKIPQPYLTYKYTEELEVGRIIEVNVRNASVWAVVLKKVDVSSLKFDESKVKEIENKLPVILGEQNIKFLYAFSQNTFNTLNTVLNSFLQPFKLLTKKQWSELSSKQVELAQNTPPASGSGFNVLFDLNIYTTLRIIYIIRSHLNTTKKRILLVFPETKHINRFLDELTNQQDFTEIKKKLDIFIYTGSPDKESKKTVWSILNQNSKTTIILSTRSGLFLPFNKLDEIILVDEANSFHIQDQNQIYFDTRDVIYLMAQSFQSKLTFLSTLPSIRLYNFYQSEVFTQFKEKY